MVVVIDIMCHHIGIFYLINGIYDTNYSQPLQQHDVKS
jgi:hypothetical protein